MYLDKDSNEVENILNHTKDVIIRAANIKKYPYQMIDKGDTLYVLQNDSKSLVYGSVIIKEAIFNEYPIREERVALMNKYQDRAKLSKKKTDYILARKYISVFIVDKVQKLHGTLDTSNYKKVEDFIQFIPKGE